MFVFWKIWRGCFLETTIWRFVLLPYSLIFAKPFQASVAFLYPLTTIQSFQLISQLTRVTP